MLTYKETDYPVAIINPYGDGEERTVYYSEEYKAQPPAEIRKLLEMYDLILEDLKGEIECLCTGEGHIMFSDQMRGSPCS